MSTASTEWRRKVDWLSRRDAYAPAPPAVEIVETHFALVFLAGALVYKLKKPLRFRQCDFTTLDARRANCELEVALNRRLTTDVYLGVVPLTVDGGTLSLGGGGIPVDWLVKMRRLPAERTLDRLAASGPIPDSELEGLLATLAAFYAAAARAPWDGAAYRAALLREIRECATALTAPELGLDARSVAPIANELTAQVSSTPALFEARAAAGRIIDAHGDLRPEHVFLTTPRPQIIDCLEFSAPLRLQDSAAEIAFLALECERLGHSALASRLLELYRTHCADDVDARLLLFYRRLRALARAMLAAWHLPESTPAAAERWRGRADWYLRVAARGDREPHPRHR